jgi:hypothetical protein
VLTDHSELIEAVCLHELEALLLRGFNQQLVVKFVFLTGLAFLVHYRNVDQLLDWCNGSSDIVLNDIIIKELGILA